MTQLLPMPFDAEARRPQMFPALTPEQVARVMPFGVERTFADHEIYQRVMDAPMGIGPITGMLSLTVRDWLSEGLLAVFFLVVGLEIAGVIGLLVLRHGSPERRQTRAIDTPWLRRSYG